MADFTKWTRRDFGDPGGVPPTRAEAEKETNQDLQKPIQQLICDVLEIGKSTTFKPEYMLIGMTNRVVAMLGRVALEHERSTRKLVILTRWIAGLTVALVFLTIVLVYLTCRLLLHGG